MFILRAEELVNLQSKYQHFSNFLTMEDNQEAARLYYLQQLCDTSLGHNVFKSPWGGVILKNCGANGEIYSFKTIKEYKETQHQLWLYLDLKIFCYRDHAYPIFCCPQCDSMVAVKNFGLHADPSDISKLQCIHSKAAGFIVKNWHEIWEITLEDSDTAMAVFCNNDVKYFTFQSQSKNQTFLAGVQVGGQVFLLQTVTMRQKQPFSPFCSKCSRQSCIHWQNYKRLVEEEEPFAFNHLISDTDDEGHESQGNIIEHDRDNLEDGSEEEQEDEVVGGVEEPDIDVLHWRKMPTIDVYHELYGYNVTDIVYPFQLDQNLQSGWLRRMAGEYTFPAQFIPTWLGSNVCKHNNIFDPDDNNLVHHSSNITVYTNIGERVFDVQVMVRKTIAGCNCLQQFDGHPHLLWHLGNGRFVDYTWLHLHLHRMRSEGIGTYAEYKSLTDALASTGISSSLSYKDLHRAVCGFFRRLKFNEKISFSCPTHGNSPRFLNTDGKNLGPLKRKVRNISELEKHPEDREVLGQSTFFKNRTFLSNIKERTLVLQLLAGDISKHEFCISENIETENGRLIVNLVAALGLDDEEIPRPYRRFIKNISKPTSVRGLIQVTSHAPLQYLKQFCDGTTNIKSVEEKFKLQVVLKQLPVLWPMLENICNLERSAVLPPEICAIVLKLLHIREQTFRNAAPRNNVVYHAYEDAEQPKNSYYPNNPVVRHPKQYEVNNVKDKDLCDKAFIGHSHFAAGIFSAGCACKYNITLGWELMLSNESPRNLFRLLTCNSFDLEKMEGVLMDHACKFDSYMLNREAKQLEHLLTLVDGSHWNSQKKMKHPTSKKGGHLGCSEESFPNS